MPEKGLNRGGAKGQQSEPGKEEANLERPGWQQEQSNLERPGWQQEQSNLDRKRPAQRGGLQREPDLTGREEETGHEVD